MKESNNALPPLDDSFWEHLEHIDFSIAIPVSATKMLNILGALSDIYKSICDGTKDNAKESITALAAILVASKYDKADAVWEEIAVRESMTNFDKHLQEILDGE
jgi:hypothetical protein